MEVANVDQLHRLEQLKLRARADRRATSVPLFTFGAVTLFFALTEVLRQPGNVARIGGISPLVLLWPAAFGFLAWYYRRQEARTGVGAGRGSYALMVLLPIAVFFVPFAWLLYFFLSSTGVAALGLLVIALLQRNWYLGISAVVYGVVMTLEAYFFLSNRLVDLGQEVGVVHDLFSDHATAVVLGLTGLGMVAAGLVARRREARAS
jgi:hypothetical protein